MAQKTRDDTTAVDRRWNVPGTDPYRWTNDEDDETTMTTHTLARHGIAYELIKATQPRYHGFRWSTAKSHGTPVEGGPHGFDNTADTTDRTDATPDGVPRTPSGFGLRGSPEQRRLLTELDHDTPLFNAIAFTSGEIVVWYHEDDSLPVAAASLIADTSYFVTDVEREHADTPYTRFTLNVEGGDSA